MGRYRVPDNAVFRRGSGRGIARLEYPKSDEWDPAKINQAVNMVSNINNAATGILGAKPLDLIVSGIARAAKDDDPIQTGVRRAATARMRAQRDTGQQTQEQPAPQQTAPAEPPRPQAQEGMDLTSIGSFGEARRYARSGIPGGGLRTFRWNGKLYSTVGYQDEKGPRSEQRALETEADWSADLKRSRDKRFYSDDQPAPVPQPAAPEPVPTQKIDPVAVASLFEEYEVNPEDGIERLREIIALTKENVSTPQEIIPEVGYPDVFGKPPLKPVNQELVDSVTKDQAMLEAYTQQQAAQPQQEVVQEQFTEESVDPDVSAARRRQQDRIREIREGRATPQREVRRRQMTGALEMLRSGSIPMPTQLPSNVEDIASIAMVVTDRRALPNLVRAARDSAMPTSFADLFTGNHERRAAKTVLDSFVKGEGKRTTPMDMSKLIQNEEKLRIARSRLENQDRNVTSQIERRRVQNNLSRVNNRIKSIELAKLLKIKTGKSTPTDKTIDDFLLKETGDSLATVVDGLTKQTNDKTLITQEDGLARLATLRQVFNRTSFRKKLMRKGITNKQIQEFVSKLQIPIGQEGAKKSADASKQAVEVALTNIKLLADSVPGSNIYKMDEKTEEITPLYPFNRTTLVNKMRANNKILKAAGDDLANKDQSRRAKDENKILRAKLTAMTKIKSLVDAYNNALRNEAKRFARQKRSK